MATWYEWFWGITPAADLDKELSEARSANMLVGHGAAALINDDILKQGKTSLKHVDAPVEKLHVLEFKPAVLAPTANLSLIKRSWLGITCDVLTSAIKNLRRTETAVHDNFAPRSAVLQELMRTTPKLKAVRFDADVTA